jgi:hypothetical protein
MSSSLKSSITYFGNINKLITILEKYKTSHLPYIQLCENNIIFEFKLYTSDFVSNDYENHIDKIVSNIKKIDSCPNNKPISLKKTKNNIFII